ncbi:hypothetical protein RD149_20875 [Gordonia westfalica]|uniref:Glycosyltransferase RgtA/B/C/D-like domain-containing protein n=1 Tax=Gordonia westfalica TaxID=158898 RepID=A0ABU2GXL4_9ACTN|nr:hypothetical protein [Gordonia westfalica]MDS1116201.1 hypothetical protein [Gordonia westfalica]
MRSIAASSFDQYGLLSGASPLYAASILLAFVAFGIAVRQRNPSAAGAAILAMIICQRLPRALSTEAPMYAWTYKHLGVVDHVQQSHSLAHGVDVYNGWPGLFVVTAWISDLTGVAPTAVAHWFTPVYHVILAALVFAAARAWRLSRDESLVSTFLVVTLNWVEQDYFAPQAIGMLLTVGIIALLGLSDKKPTGTVPLLILFGALAITHQLTPYWVLGASCLLVLGRKLKPWWIVLLMAAILGGFLVYNFDVLSGYTLLSGDVADNASTNGSGHVGMAGQVFSSSVMRILTVGMWGTTAIVLLLRWRRGREFWAPAVLAFSPILILGGQNYGGEAVFRVFLYSLPGCAFVLAPGIVVGLRAGWKRFASTFVALAVATAMAAQATTANWYTNLIGGPQVAVAGEVLAGDVYPAYVTPLVPVWPERSTGDYVRFAEFTDTFDHSLMFQPGLLGRSFASESDYRQLMGLIEARNRPTYLVLSEPMRAFGAYFGLFPGEAITNLAQRLRSDPRWRVVDERPGVWVYLYPSEN